MPLFTTLYAALRASYSIFAAICFIAGRMIRLLASSNESVRSFVVNDTSTPYWLSTANGVERSK
jgi:hypothetical protein